MGRRCSRAVSCLTFVTIASGAVRALASPPPADTPDRVPPDSVPPDFVFRPSAPPADRKLIEERSFGARPLMLELRGGSCTIVGLVGATVSIDPWSRVTLGGGLGASPAGLQLAAFARVRPLVFTGRRWARLHAIGLELGYSTGPFKDFIVPVDGGEAASTYSWDNVKWLQPQVTYETRSYRGFNLLAGAGVAIPIAKHGYHCLDAKQCKLSPISVLPTVTVGVAWAFGI